MITSEQAYLKFIQKVNKNFTNDNISVDRGRFVLIFNEVQNRFVEWILEKRNSDDIRDIQLLLEKDVKLSKDAKILNHQDFKLPDDYFSFVNLQVFAKSGSCGTSKIGVHEVKSENVEELLIDENNKPSFEFRETFYTISGDTVDIYTDNFDISKAYLTYYRYPKQIDLEGYINIEGKTSTSINPEFEDRIVDRILNAAAKDFDINNENFNKSQFDNQRIFSKI